MKDLKNLTKDIKTFSYIIDKDFLIWPEDASNIEKSIVLVEKWELKEHIKETIGFFNNSKFTQKKIDIIEEYDEESITNYHIIINSLQEVFANCERNKKIYYQDIIDISKKVIEFYKKHEKNFLNYIKIPKSLANYNLIHSVNTAILTVAIAKGMNLNNYKTMELCVAALVHKIGFLFIPKAITEKEDKLTDEEFNTIKKYPLINYKIISATDFPKSVCLILLTHKENLDGSGYPQKLKSENISIEANIIGATSAYIAITLDKSYKKSSNSGASLLELIRDADKKFDKRVLKLIIDVLSQYPLNSIVELVDGSIAKIVQTNEDNSNNPYFNYLVKDGKVISQDKQPLVKTIPQTETEIKKILSQNEVEAIKEKYALE